MLQDWNIIFVIRRLILTCRSSMCFIFEIIIQKLFQAVKKMIEYFVQNPSTNLNYSILDSTKLVRHQSKQKGGTQPLRYGTHAS